MSDTCSLCGCETEVHERGGWWCMTRRLESAEAELAQARDLLAEARKLITDYCAAVAMDPYAEPPMCCRSVRDAHNAMMEYHEQHKPKEEKHG